MTEHEMVRWHHCLNGHEFEETLGDSEGQGSLECCSSRSRRVGHDLATEHNKDKKILFQYLEIRHYLRNIKR